MIAPWSNLSQQQMEAKRLAENARQFDDALDERKKQFLVNSILGVAAPWMNIGVKRVEGMLPWNEAAHEEATKQYDFNEANRKFNKQIMGDSLTAPVGVSDRVNEILRGLGQSTGTPLSAYSTGYLKPAFSFGSAAYPPPWGDPERGDE